MDRSAKWSLAPVLIIAAMWVSQRGGTCSLVALWNDLATYIDSSLPRLAILKGEPLLASSAIPSLCSNPPVCHHGRPILQAAGHHHLFQHSQPAALLH